jgi:GDP-L-fucose synthase
VGSGADCTILELANTIKDVVGFSGDLIFDHSKPDGTPQKMLDASRINRMGWRHKISLAKGISDVYTWYKSQAPIISIESE